MKCQSDQIKLPKSCLRFAARFSIRCSLIVAFFSPLRTVAQTKTGEAALNLQTLEDFHAAEISLARKPVDGAEASYRSNLLKYQKTAQAAGNLKSLLATKQAIEDLDAGRPPIVNIDPDVAAIQKNYQTQRQKAEAESAKALAKANQEHLTSLKKLVVDLTKSGNIDQAQEVQTKLDGFTVQLNPATESRAQPFSEREIEMWKKKALDEFPAMADPNSSLSKQVKSLKELKKSSPNYFSNAQWPYLLAKEASLKEEEEIARKNRVNRIELDGKLVIKARSKLLLPGEAAFMDSKLKVDVVSDGRAFPVYRELWNQPDVFVIHPLENGVPGTVDFSGITQHSHGTLIIKIRDHPRGDCRFEIWKADREMDKKNLDQDRWVSTTITFEKESVMLKIFATGWNDEFSFITYEIR